MTFGHSTAVDSRIARRAPGHRRTQEERANETRRDRVRSTGDLTSVTSDLADVIGADVIVNLRGSDVSAILAMMNGTADEHERDTARTIAQDLAATKFPDDPDMIQYLTRNI